MGAGVLDMGAEGRAALDAAAEVGGWRSDDLAGLREIGMLLFDAEWGLACCCRAAEEMGVDLLTRSTAPGLARDAEEMGLLFVVLLLLLLLMREMGALWVGVMGAAFLREMGALLSTSLGRESAGRE